MIYFTKEELQIILLDMETYINTNRMNILRESPIHKSLRDKIQSIIDKFCEQEHKHEDDNDV